MEGATTRLGSEPHKIRFDPGRKPVMLPQMTRTTSMGYSATDAELCTVDDRAERDGCVLPAPNTWTGNRVLIADLLIKSPKRNCPLCCDECRFVYKTEDCLSTFL